MQRDEHNAGAGIAARASQVPDVPRGIVVHADGDAAKVAREMTRSASRGGAPDPLAGLVDRIRAEGHAEVAFDELVTAAAADMRDTDQVAYEALRRDLKAVGVAIARWDAAVAERVRTRRKAAKDDERERAQHDVALRREARQVEREAERTAREAERTRAAEDVAAHYREGDDGNGTAYTTTPGRTVMETPGRRGEVERTVLAHASILNLDDVREVAAPDEVPRRVRRLSVVCEGDAAPHTVEVHTGAWAQGVWLDTLIPARGRVPADRKLRAHLLDAITACSTPREVNRYGFTGRVRAGGRSMHLHGGGAIDASGDVGGVEVVLKDPAHLYHFPPMPKGEDRLTAARGMVELLSAEPASVFVTAVALAARSVQGASRAAVHVVGGKGVGKTTSCRLIASLFGPEMARKSPASWKNDSAIAINVKASQVGDALLLVEDLQPDDAAHRKTDDVLRPYFDGLAASKGRREGGMRTTPAPRCAFLSNGEVRLRGHSLTSRVVTVCLDRMPTLDLERLTRLAREGTLAEAMALYVMWYSPRYDEHLGQLDVREREAARAWGLGEGGRGADLLGALALGMEGLLAFLGPGGLLPGGVLDASEVAEHRARAEEALREVLRGYDEGVGEEDPARLFCDTLGEALRAGRVHLAATLGTEREGAERQGVPHEPASKGWREEQIGSEVRWRAQGARVGYVNLGDREVCLDPGPAFEAAADRARAAGRPFAVDREAVGRALRTAGVLARTGSDGKTTVQVRVGAGARIRVWVLRPEALGYDPA